MGVKVSTEMSAVVEKQEERGDERSMERVNAERTGDTLWAWEC
jgi:hypothetical protein